MPNRMEETALHILTQTSHRIKVESVGPDKSRHYFLDVNKLPQAQKGEVFDALKLLGGDSVRVTVADDTNSVFCQLRVYPMDSHARVNITKGEDVTKDQVAAFARKLADAGVNFPGNAAFLSPQKQ